MPNRKLSRYELIAINELLKQHLVPGNTEGFFNYQNEWSDAKIALSIAPDIQATTVGNVRLELFGKLETSKNLSNIENQKIKDLETITQNLLGCYQKLEINFNLLVDNLAANKIVNVRHLKTTYKE